jgi:transposase
VCVLDDTGRKATAFVITHTADGFDQLVACLRGYGDPAGLPVAIERPDGRLVDRLLEAGHPVVSVQPNAIKAWRDAEVLSGAKNDPGDAALIAEYLRLRQHRLRVLAPFSAQTRALAGWSAPATTSSTNASPPPTSSAPAWTGSGPAPRPSSPTLTCF